MTLADTRDAAREQLNDELVARGVEVTDAEATDRFWLEDDGLYQFIIRGGSAQMELVVRPAPAWTPGLVLQGNGQIRLERADERRHAKKRTIWELTVRLEVCVRPDLDDIDRALRLHDATAKALSSIGFWLDDEDSSDRAFWECDTGWMMFARSPAEAADCIAALQDLRCRRYPDGAPWDHLFSWCANADEQQLLADAGVWPPPSVPEHRLACRVSKLGRDRFRPADDEDNGHV
jgi:hypothetical protein